jgi:16S rRNA (guanine527-N7)-methyltransferase
VRRPRRAVARPPGTRQAPAGDLDRVSFERLAAIFGLGEAQLKPLARYVELLGEWPANVTGLRERDQMISSLLGDSLALADLEEMTAALSGALLWVDLGAGGGVPGLPLALCWPAARVALLESVGKKCAFLRAAVVELSLGARVGVVCARSEEHAAVGAAGREAYGLVTARAVGPLPTVIELAAPLLTLGGAVLLPTSRRRAEQEWAAGVAAASRCGLELRGAAPLPRSPLRGSVCVVARKAAPAPGWLPRRPGRARTRPLGS